MKSSAAAAAPAAAGGHSRRQQQEATARLENLKNEVFENLDKRAQNISESLSKIERTVGENETQNVNNEQNAQNEDIAVLSDNTATAVIRTSCVEHYLNLALRCKEIRCS